MLRVEASEGSVLSSSNAAPGWSKEGLGLGRYSNPPSKGNLPPHINVPRKHEVVAQPEFKTRVSMLNESRPPPPPIQIQWNLHQMADPLQQTGCFVPTVSRSIYLSSIATSSPPRPPPHDKSHFSTSV